MSLLSHLKETGIGQDILEIREALNDKSGPLPDPRTEAEERQAEEAFLRWLDHAKIHASEEEHSLLQEVSFYQKMKKIYFELFYGTKVVGTGATAGGLLKLAYDLNHNTPELGVAMGLIAFAYTCLMTYGLTYEKHQEEKDNRVRGS